MLRDRWSDLNEEPLAQLVLATLKLADLQRPSDNATSAELRVREWLDAGKPDCLINFDDFRYYATRARLDSWVDWDQAANFRPKEAGRILEAVAVHYDVTSALRETGTLAPADLPTSVLDDAAVLWGRLTAHLPFANLEQGVSFESMRADFLSDVNSDFEERRMAASLLAPPAAKTRTTVNEDEESLSRAGSADAKKPYFDGFALRNAEGSTFERLLSALWSDAEKERAKSGLLPRAPDETPSQLSLRLNLRLLRKLLERKFAEVAEDMQYTIGTPEHSMATVIARIHAHQRKSLPAPFESSAELFKAFREIEREWLAKRNYPIQPRLLFALHLMRSSGAKWAGAAWRTGVLFATISPAFLDACRRAKEEGRVDPMAWEVRPFLENIQRWLLSPLPGESVPADVETSVKRRVTELNRAAESILGRSTRRGPFEGVEVSLASRPAWRRPDANGELAKLLQSARSVERLFGNAWQARTRAALSYGNERLYAVFGSPPHPFDREAAAAEILARAGLTDDEIYRHRRFSYGMPGREQYGSGTGVDEYLARVESGFASDASWKVNGKHIYVTQALEAEERQYNATLANHPWIRARARENLRMRHVHLGAQAIEEEVGRLVAQHSARTETQRVWQEGFETWIGMVPVVGATYTIVQGVRDRNPWEVIAGSFFLGLDALDLVGGEAPEHAGMRTRTTGAPAHEISAVNDINHAMRELRLPSHDIARHMHGGSINSNPHGIAVRDANVPEDFRALAMQVRQGEAGLKWRGLDVVYLNNEDRVVPVQHSGGSYREVDWYTGNVRPSRRLIHRDGERYFTDLGLKGGAPRHDFEVDGEKVSERRTVKQVLATLEQARDTNNYGIRPHFRRCFRLDVELGATQFEIENFYVDLYSASPTFRRLFNRAIVEAPNQASPPAWTIKVKKGLRAATNFGQRHIQLPTDSELLAEQFVGIDGFKPVQLRQAYLHEMVHALTFERDPELSIATRHRGAIVYLTDRILYESGHDLPLQVMYRRPSLNPEANADLNYQRVWAARLMIAEDKLLDAEVERHLPAYGEGLALGWEVDDRLTVRTVRALRAQIESEPLLASDPDTYLEALPEQFIVVRSTKAFDTHDLRAFYWELCEESATFSEIAARWMKRNADAGETKRWRVIVEGADPDAENSAPSMYDIDDDSATMRIYVDGSQYLSDDGLWAVEFDRRLTYAVVDLMTNLEHPTVGIDALRNRGGLVYVGQRILWEYKPFMPRQIAYQLAAASDASAQRRMLADLTNIRRAADQEDRRLDESMRGILPKIFTGCVGCDAR